MMPELPLVFMAGFLGSAHCVGMCGGFVASIGAAADGARQNLIRQLLYSLGRITTYMFLGATAGFLGHLITERTSDLLLTQGILALLAGVLLCAQGLQSARIFPGWTSSGTGAACRAARLFRSFLLSPRRADVLIAGVLTGFLPCGLVYAHLTLAASQSQVAISALLMVVFGAGTVPVMILTGSGMSVLGLQGRRRLLRIAAWCVVLTGALTVNRGVSAIRVARGTSSAACPLCEEGSHVHIQDSSASSSE